MPLVTFSPLSRRWREQKLRELEPKLGGNYTTFSPQDRTRHILTDRGVKLKTKVVTLCV